MSTNLEVIVNAYEDDLTTGVFAVLAGFNNAGSGTWKQLAHTPTTIKEQP